MTEAESSGGAITVGDTLRWLHEDGLKRLGAFGKQQTGPTSVYTIAVDSGVVGAHESSGQSVTVAADDLPAPAVSPGRLVVVGVTEDDETVVADLGTLLQVCIRGERPELAARSWVMQLLLNPDLTLTTNGTTMAIGDSPRYRHRFIPSGGATVITVDDGRSLMTTVQLNPRMAGPDRLECYDDGTAELCVSDQVWSLTHVLTIDDDAWADLTRKLTATDAQNHGGPPPVSTPRGTR